ncbi:MAG: hypothetical protein JOZ31_20200 [Verrucomicrobia bacterium]|nr:hypothetical protein [Verrucomicrobiota bacterium]MBV8485747.1 hypothetical protein [Verrucomicrobiota bacterium]
MSSNNSVELYGYCRSREETVRVLSRLDKAGISETLVRGPGKVGQWQPVAKPSRSSVFKSLLTGLPVGAVVGALIAVSTRTEQAGAASRSQIGWGWLSIVLLIVFMALLWGGIAALANIGLSKLRRNPENERTGNDRYLVTIRCRAEDKSKVQALLVSQGAMITNEQGPSADEERMRGDG